MIPQLNALAAAAVTPEAVSKVIGGRLRAWEQQGGAAAVQDTP